MSSLVCHISTDLTHLVHSQSPIHSLTSITVSSGISMRYIKDGNIQQSSQSTEPGS